MSPRRRRIAVTALGGLFVATLVAAQACLAPTQLTLVVDTDVPCPELKGVAITVSDRPEGAETKGFVTAETSDCQATGRVGTLVVTPSDSGRAAIVVVAGVTKPARECSSANGYEGCIVARRLVSFVDHTALVVPVRLEVDCLDVPCNAISTCSKGRCVSSETTCDDTDCSKVGVAQDGGEALVDAPTSNDATVPPDATGPADAAEDVSSPNDAATDALVSCAYDPRVPCNGGRCQAGQVCCQNMTTFAEYCAVMACNGNDRTLRCRSNAECDGGLICCLAPSYAYTQCGSSCGTGGSDGGVPFSYQVCSAGCPSCKTGTCKDTGSGYASCQ